MTNPFDLIDARLSRLEATAQKTLELVMNTQTPTPEVGGMTLAKEITGLSVARLYALVSARAIPHHKRGNRLYFNKAELLAWIEEGKRGVRNDFGDQSEGAPRGKNQKAR